MGVDRGVRNDLGTPPGVGRAPWKRIRGHRGRETRAASRGINSRGDIPNRGGTVVVWAFELPHDLALAVAFEPLRP
jgi:hypothetical protein